MRYPLAHVNYGDEEIDAVVDALEHEQTTCGTRVRRFETKFANYIGRKYAIMVNSGSSADLLVAFGLGPATYGDEILVPAVTWPTQVWSCLMAGYRVRLVDVDPLTLQMDMKDLATKITGRARAIFPAHILGAVGDMDTLLNLASQYNLTVLEDCCEALGARWNGCSVGTFGNAAAFSFFFSHLISTMEGGMVVTNMTDADRLYRLWRSHGWEPKQDYRFWFPTWGLNIRPTELQGAFGCVQMTRLEKYIRARLRNYTRLASQIYGQWSEYLSEIAVLPNCEPSWHGFPIMVREGAPFTRDELCRYLDKHGVENRPIVAGNLARQPAIIDDERVICGSLPGADKVHENGFYIGLASFDDYEGCAYVAEIINSILKL